MKRIIIICEGQTEQEFCKSILYHHFINDNIFIECPLIKKSLGGIVPWQELKKQIQIHLKQDTSAFVTTLIDYYGIPQKFNYPNWIQAHNEKDINKTIDILQQGMLQDVASNQFIPYIQLHELEGLLFNDIKIFNSIFYDKDFTNFDELKQIIIDYPNPELINNGKETAPSKRLKKLIRGYDKKLHSSIIAKEIGLHNIKKKSPRFTSWINTLLSI